MITKIKKINILTCQEFPSAVLKEKKRKEVRVQLWVKQKENQNTSIWQRLYTTERQKYCRMQKTCQKWHKTCCYCQHAQNDGLVCLSNHLLLPWPRMTQSIWHKPSAQRSSHPCAQIFQIYVNGWSICQKNITSFASSSVSLIYLVPWCPVNNDKCHMTHHHVRVGSVQSTTHKTCFNMAGLDPLDICCWHRTVCCCWNPTMSS